MHIHLDTNRNGNDRMSVVRGDWSGSDTGDLCSILSSSRRTLSSSSLCRRKPKAQIWCSIRLLRLGAVSTTSSVLLQVTRPMASSLMSSLSASPSRPTYLEPIGSKMDNYQNPPTTTDHYIQSKLISHDHPTLEHGFYTQIEHMPTTQ